ncbi:hypothetical protein [Comamonas sp. JC664]|uniref:cytidylate kinase family protein n=1 Tax=Comamonas sp. JC664 TaxID=2801917 RepID=UPI00174D1134|nr:hypothetical protein [Comamonas sp. JC664]MBL0692583.1 hypothetical protein [Comamonas sp. JC664]GHG92720.1 hypothetical protein GCM10012319_54470 [Comamonas sp. KCTC 72670]
MSESTVSAVSVPSELPPHLATPPAPAPLPGEALLPHGPLEGCSWCAAGPDLEEVQLGPDRFGVLARSADPGGVQQVLFPRAPWGHHLTRARLSQVLGFVEARLHPTWTARLSPRGGEPAHFQVGLRQGAEPLRAFLSTTRMPLALPVQRGHASAGLVRGWGHGAVVVKGDAAETTGALAWDVLEHLLVENVPHEVVAWNEETGVALAVLTRLSEAALEPLYRHALRAAATAQRREGQRVFTERGRAGAGGLWVAMGDIDKLQCLNRLYGRRLVGDESHGMIRRLFERLDLVARRDGACFFRYLSGDEFGVISRPGATAAEFGRTLASMRESARDLADELAVLRVTGVDGGEPSVVGQASVAAWLAEPDGGLKLLVWKRPEWDAEATRRAWAQRLREGHGDGVDVQVHPFQDGALWAPTLSIGATPVPAPRGPEQEHFAEAMALATSLCKRAKMRRDCIVLVEQPPEDAKAGESDSAILKPGAKALLRWLHTEGALPVARELRDPVTGLLCQEALEGELLGAGLGGDDTFLQLTDSAYTSERFVEQEHRPIKWGPVHQGVRMGARIMAVNEFYGFDAGSDAIQLVAAAVLRHLRPGWRERVRVARAPPDKVQVWLACPASPEEVLAFLDDVQREMNEALLPGLSVRLKAVRIAGANVSRGAEVLDMVDPLRSVEAGVDVLESPKERHAPGTGNVLASHGISPEDGPGRRAFQAASARFSEEQSRESAVELLRVYRDRLPRKAEARSGGASIQSPWTVVIGGRHGAGKNTLAERLALAVGLRAYNVGDLKRRMSAVRGFDSVQRYSASLDAGAARELDAFLDGLQAERVLAGGALIHSFFGPWVVSRLAPELNRRGGRVLRVLLECPLEERARRVFARHAEGDASGTLDEVCQQLAARDVADLANLAKLAGPDAAEVLLHPERYDLVVDTSLQSPDAVAARVLERLAAP